MTGHFARRRLRALLAAMGSMLVATAATAQGTLSIQGFGFAPGQLSARARGAGGALGEGDPFSPLNPASPAVFRSKFLSFQMEPEYRTVTSPTESKSSTTARYPVVFAAMPVGERWVVSLSSSTILDRTWATADSNVENIRGENVQTASDQRVSGAMDDIRLGAAWSNRSWLRLGLAVHGTSGHNVVSLARVFPDTSPFSTFSQVLTVSFTGGGASAGAEVLANKATTLSVAFRYGGRVHAMLGDSLLSAANLPDRIGFGLGYGGIKGTTLAARASYQNWSSLAPLGSGTSQPVDSWDMSLGAEMQGPRFRSRSLDFRAGLHSRTLPFQAAGNSVRERSVAAGTGFAVAGGLVLIDLAATRSWRDAGLSVSERAWTFSVGLSARP